MVLRHGPPPPILVSVVIPTRNRREHLEKAIGSVLAQTYGELEVIVVDDGSEDASREVVDRMRQHDPRITCVRHPEPRGAQAARNTGVNKARGEVVAFLDDDCAWHPTKVEKQIAAMSEGRGLVYCRHAIRQAGEWIVEGQVGVAHDAVKGLLRKNYIGTYSILVRRELLGMVGGFDEGLPRLQDWDLLLRLARHTAFAFVPEILVHGFQLSSGISMNREALEIAADRMVENHAPFLSRMDLAAFHYGLGKYLLADGLAGKAQSYFARALKLDPLSPAHWGGLVTAMVGPQPARWLRARHRRISVSPEEIAELDKRLGREQARTGVPAKGTPKSNS